MEDKQKALQLKYENWKASQKTTNEYVNNNIRYSNSEVDTISNFIMKEFKVSLDKFLFKDKRHNISATQQEVVGEEINACMRRHILDDEYSMGGRFMYIKDNDVYCGQANIDIDVHDDDDAKSQNADLFKIYNHLQENDITPLLCYSGGHRGFHLNLMFEDEIKLKSLFPFLYSLYHEFMNLGLEHAHAEQYPECKPNKNQYDRSNAVHFPLGRKSEMIEIKNNSIIPIDPITAFSNIKRISTKTLKAYCKKYKYVIPKGKVILTNPFVKELEIKTSEEIKVMMSKSLPYHHTGEVLDDVYKSLRKNLSVRKYLERHKGLVFNGNDTTDCCYHAPLHGHNQLVARDGNDTECAYCWSDRCILHRVKGSLERLICIDNNVSYENQKERAFFIAEWAYRNGYAKRPNIRLQMQDYINKSRGLIQ